MAESLPPATPVRTRPSRADEVSDELTVHPAWRAGLLAAAGVRAVLALVAVPLAPLLLRENRALLVLLRPTKEVLLAAGFEVRKGSLSLLTIALAVIPLGLAGVWIFYGLGRLFGSTLLERAEDADSENSGDQGLVARVTAKLLPVERIEALNEILDRKGGKLIVLGRLAVFPSTLVAAAAGAAGMPARTFLVSDTIGFSLSLIEVVGAGFLLGEAYERGGPFVTGAGAVVAFGLLVALGRYLRSAEDSTAAAE